MAKLGFNPQSAEKREDRGCMPAGDYLAIISASDVVAGKHPGSQILKLTYSCVGEGFKGRQFWQNLNITNESVKAQEIAQSELREICEAVGLGGTFVDDSAMLHNKPMMVRLKIEIDKGKVYPPKNSPESWKPAGSSPAAAAGGFKAPVTAAAAAPAFKPPVAQAAAAPAYFAQLAAAPAPQQELEQESQPSETSTTTSPSDAAEADPEVAVGAVPAQAARPTPPWMKRS